MNLDNFVLLFCNGVPPSNDRLRTLVPRPAKIVCADGGAHKAISIGYEPDFIVGDLDSLDPSNGDFKNTEIVKVPSQDNTDFEKTLDAMIERGWKSFLITSFSGGRIDQTLANIQIAYEYSKKYQIALADEQYLIIPVFKNLAENVGIDTNISIIPMEDNTIVSTSGLAYELNHSRMPKGGHGISNRAVKDEIVISVHEGGVLVFIKDV